MFQMIFPKKSSPLKCIYCAVMASIFAMVLTSCTANMERVGSFVGGGQPTAQATPAVSVTGDPNTFASAGSTGGSGTTAGSTAGGSTGGSTAGSTSGTTAGATGGTTGAPAPAPVGTAISTAAELASMSLSGTYYLLNDIDLAGVSIALGSFSGTLDGRGFSIKNFTQTNQCTNKSTGLFAELAGGTIKNLKMDNCNITSNCQHIGCLVGNAVSGSITHSSVQNGLVTCTGDVNGNTAWACGGLIGGLSAATTVEFDWADITVNGGQTYATGGLVGGEPSGSGGIAFSISNSFALGNVTGQWLVGGLTGGLGGGGSTVTLTNCFAAGQVQIGGNWGTFGGGGLIGHASTCTANNAYYNSDLNSQSACGQGLSVSQFTGSSSFVGWDPAVWDFSGAMPTLQ